MEKLLDIITKVVLYSAFSLLPLGWLYWVYLAVKFGGFIMFVGAFFPLLTPFSAVIGAWAMIFGVPDWMISFFFGG